MPNLTRFLSRPLRAANPFALSSTIIVAAILFLTVDYAWPGTIITSSQSPLNVQPDSGAKKKSTAELVRRAEERSRQVKGVYMTSAVASDPGRPATHLRNSIIELLDTTELNAVVIDVKETSGGFMLTENLGTLIHELHQKNIWVIARMATFKDNSQEKIHPQWYLKRASGGLWRDRRGGSWLDPASRDVWNYEIDLAKRASDAGFDEIQFDYVRFPSDGDVKNAIYPVFDAKQQKYEVLRGFFRSVHEQLKSYRPELVLSADLFGYVAVQTSDLGIGQRLADIGENFDFVSLMVYPSHYYAGFQVPADPERDLAAIFYPYQSSMITSVVSNHPFDVVYRSMLVAGDTLAGRKATVTDPSDQSSLQPSGLDKNNKAVTTSSPASSPSTSTATRHAHLRPWLQDFDLAVDSSRGISYDAAKVRAQIDAAEQSGTSGWLLWNPNNVYTRAALKPK